MWHYILVEKHLEVIYQNIRCYFPILSMYCECLQSRSTKKCTYYTDIYFTLSDCYMFRLVAIFKELTTK